MGRRLRLLLVSAVAISCSIGCSVDDDCSLNGVCATGVCACDAGWTGATCSQLNLLPAPLPPENGYNVPNTSSWGAGVIQDALTGSFHMYVSEFINHCGLLSWHNNSRVVHAVSVAATGPYLYSDEVIPAYAHNPSVAPTADGDGLILVHIGAGVWNGQQPECVNGSTQSRLNATATPPLSPATASSPYPTLCSNGVNQAWLPCNWTGSAAPSEGTNPTIWVMSNGSIATGGNSNYSLSFTLGVNCTRFACDTWSAPVNVTPNRTGEDPWIWQDARDHWHALFHDMSPDAPTGRHAFSRDGVAWTLTSELVYNGTVLYADGSSITYTKRERPHLLLDVRTRTPLALFTGVMQFAENIDDHTWTLAQAIHA